MKENYHTNAANLFSNEMLQSPKNKRIKLKTLLKRFGYEKRTEESAARITQLLYERNILIQPSIMKIGAKWILKIDDQVTLSTIEEPQVPRKRTASLVIDTTVDNWFNTVDTNLYRTEKEVTTKFLIPLLGYLGYTEPDRYDGMPVSGAYGSRAMKLEVDSALFNVNDELLSNQVLLIAEAKKENRLVKSVEIDNARNQVKSYGLFASCLFGLITDGKIIEVISLYPTIGDGNNGQLFHCSVQQLKDRFQDLHRLISKESLSGYYKALRNTENQLITF